MKNFTFLFLTFSIVFLPFFIIGFSAADSQAMFRASFEDDKWDGKTVPKGQQCRKFGGKNPSTPGLLIQDIPANANAIVMEYSDRSWPPMDNGGHGKIGYKIPAGTNKVSVPSVPGHSFKLPEGFFIIAPHQSPNWDKAGAYMPPCSGGNGNQYYVTIKAVILSPGKTDTFKELSKIVLEMGGY